MGTEERPGRLTRRRMLAMMGTAGLGAVAAACSRGGGSGAPEAQDATAGGGTADCVLTPEQTEGPYYLDLDLVRRDITEGKQGTALRLELWVVDADTCAPISGAAVDVWHADASGAYSGFGGASTGGRPVGTDATNDETFLRGIQMTDADGLAQFDTIYPGWYPGRTPHIHVKVSTGGTEVHTGQLYFPDATTSQVYSQGVYETRGQADVGNEQDGIFSNGGNQTTLALSEEGDGYVGKLRMGVIQT